MNGERAEIPTLSELYPDLTEEELREAEENLDRYVRLVWRACERPQTGKVDQAL